MLRLAANDVDVATLSAAIESMVEVPDLTGLWATIGGGRSDSADVSSATT